MTLQHFARTFLPRVSFWALIVLASAATLASAQTITNPSFETNTFAVSPGYISANTAITGWVGTPTNQVGLNIAGGQNVMANNGTVPNGTRVAFLQSISGTPAMLSTTITGLTVGSTYLVKFRYNARTGAGVPRPAYRINGETPVPFGGQSVNSTNTFTNPYHSLAFVFKATAATAPLEISNNTSTDSTLLVDNFSIAVATPIQVTSAADLGPGSLRAALTAAEGTPAFNVITFAPALNGQTITLDNQLDLVDASGVAIDASGLSNGLTLQDGVAANRLFVCGPTAIASLRGLRMSGASASSNGGAVQSVGTLLMTDCTLSGNNSGTNGGALTNSGGQLTLIRCTLSGNTATNSGGAVYSNTDFQNSFTTLIHCTLAGNTGTAGGGAISNVDGHMFLSHCTISGNTAPAGRGGGIASDGNTSFTQTMVANSIITGNLTGGDVDRDGSDSNSSFVSFGGNVIGNGEETASFNLNDVIGVDAQLSALANNGGPTQTMAIGFGSPARNRAVGSLANTDQRGRPIAGVPDSGAYEMQAGNFAFASSTFSGFEGGVAKVVIERGADVSGAATVRLLTVAGVATTADFTARANTTASDVLFLESETTKVVEIPLTADGLVEGNQNFSATLASPAPVPQAALGTPVTATVTVMDALMVNTVADEFNNPSGATVSLREALRDAAAAPGVSIIGFAPALAGKTIVLSGEIVVNDPGDVTVDASSIGGIVIDGGPGTNRLFTTTGNDTMLSLYRMTLTGGGGTGGLSSANGGAVLVDGGTTVNLTQCNLVQNTAAGSGGAINNIGILNLGQCTLSGNVSGANGGAIDNAVTLSMTQCTLSDNQAVSYGGAIESTNNGTVMLHHCTVANNRATQQSGGGVDAYYSTMTLVNCIVAGNTAPSSEDINNDNSALTVEGFNLVPEIQHRGVATVDGSGIISMDDPLLAPLADNGGYTKTHAILAGSPARDAAVDSVVTVDQRGRSLAGIADIGAFEAQQGGTFAFGSSAFAMAEGMPAQVTVNRLGGLVGEVKVRMYTVDGSATAADYAQRPNNAFSDLTFADDEATKTIPIATTADSIAEGSHTFTVMLSSPSPALAATLGIPVTATVTIKEPVLVTNVNDDGPGSLRQTLRDAAANPEPTVINFAPALSGQTIVLGSSIKIDDASGVTVDGANLAAGITIDGGPDFHSIFLVGDGANGNPRSTTLRRLTLTGGDAGSTGGAIINYSGSDLTLERCTLSQNSAADDGGAIYNDSGGGVTLNQCTLAGNSAQASGGAISNKGLMTLMHCTIAENTATSGGGIRNTIGASLELESCIVTGNGPNNDVSNDGSLNLEGNSFVTVMGGSGFTAGMGDVLTEDPLLATALANNGGPTKTLALLPNSPALDAAGGSFITSDQRGLPIVGGMPDIGAFEAQAGGTFVLSNTGYVVSEGSTALVTITRLGGFRGTASVRLFTTAGTAGAADFTGRPNTADSNIPFNEGDVSKTVGIPTTAEPVNVVEANETFTVTLGSASAGTTIGTPASASVAIRDPSGLTPAGDSTLPSAPVVSFPAAGAEIGVDDGGMLTLTGTATDNKGVVALFASMILPPGSPPPPAPVLGSLSSFGAPSTAWSAAVTPRTGLNTFSVSSLDGVGNGSPSAPRSFKVLRPLLVNVSGHGTVSAGFAPKSYREVGRPYTLTATAGAAYLFTGWTVLSSTSLTQLGITETALEKNTITFIHREGLVLRANFVPNPFVASAIGIFNGSIRPSETLPDFAPLGSDSGEDGSRSDISTEGYASLTVQPTGAFSGTLKLDGMTLNVAGTFDHTGVARFGTSRAKTLSVARGDKPSLSVSLATDVEPPLSGKITGTIAQFEGATLTTVSDVEADRAVFSATNPVPTEPYLLTGGADALYTSLFVSEGSGTPDLERFPQGTGCGTFTLAKTGTVTFAGTLADGTPISHSTTLAQDGRWRFFAQLYSMKGFVAGDVGYNLQDRDFTSPEMKWVRPVQDVQHYPAGWEEGNILAFFGAKYLAFPGMSVIPGLPAADANGNADLVFSNGLLSASVEKTVSISTADAVVNTPADTSFTLTINRTLGTFSGTFTHSDLTKPAYRGVIYQQAGSSEPQGFGFFLSTTPAVKDYLGQSGLVTLEAQ